MCCVLVIRPKPPVNEYTTHIKDIYIFSIKFPVNTTVLGCLKRLVSGGFDRLTRPILVIRFVVIWPVNEYEAVLVIRQTPSPDNETSRYSARRLTRP